MKITQFQHKNQKLDWLEIQECIGNKTIRQCYDQYVLLFKKPHKTDTRHTWTVQEERKLVRQQQDDDSEKLQYKDIDQTQIVQEITSELQIQAGQQGKLLGI
ncbi:Homeobox-like_domain superfamily [Hexamita inflata]